MAHVFSPGSEPIPGYRLVKLLGMGGFGEVWKATGPGGIEVALKIVSLETRQGFKEFSAIRMIKDIRHAGLNQIFALWLKDRDGHVFMEGLDDSANWKGKGGELIIGMGLCDKNLLDRLHELQDEGQAGIPAEELLNYMEDAARAIDYLNTPVHNLPSGLAAIQHCNIKPQNLMLAGVSVQVSDFGLARVLGDARVTQTSMSAPYTAPEMITANQPSASSDQYSLAITYVELRTGALPFENPTPAGMLFAHVQGQLDLSRLPPAEREVIRRATAL